MGEKGKMKNEIKEKSKSNWKLKKENEIKEKREKKKRN